MLDVQKQQEAEATVLRVKAEKAKERKNVGKVVKKKVVKKKVVKKKPWGRK